MAFDFGTLEPRIHQILSAPGTDLATISAKRVRRQLLETDPNLTAEFLKENKEEVDRIIASVFERVSGGGDDDEGSAEPPETDGIEQQAGGGEDNGQTSSRKRKQEEGDEGEGEYQESATPEDEDADSSSKPSPPPAKKQKKSGKNGRELSDAELARKLSSEINGRATRTGTKGRGAATATKKGRAKKSAATVDSDDDSDEDGKRKTKKKKSSPSSGGAKGGFGKEFALSEPLATLVQVEKLSRPQVVKQLWVYIKEHELQNPKNKREILCDPPMRAVFNVDKIDMFTMNKVLGQHLYEIDEQ
ncbi:SWIB-domain-containing protein [Agrocybe pediades]|nr:SWIB-domain-containing protein [Agrocybe pediades]